MISFLVADIVEIFYTVLLPFIRISAMLLVAPVLSMDSITIKIRIIIAIALTIAIYPVLDWPFIDPVSGNGLVEIFQQALIGKYAGISISVEKEAAGPPVGYPVNIEVSGEDYDELIQVAENLKNFLNLKMKLF